MNLGFYYHIPISSSSGELKIPGYLGVFLDSLASEVRQLILFMHEARDFEASQCDYVLQAKNISFVSLGYKTPAWDRFLWPGKTLRKIKSKVNECDVILVRAPSPLAPRFYDEFKDLTIITYLIVGDYSEGIKHLEQVWWRKLPAIILNLRNDRQLRRVILKSPSFVNSRELFNKYKSLQNELYEVRTTTLKYTDFYQREDTCQNGEIKILYAGVLSFNKGLRELIDAFALLVNDRYNISLNFVGEDYSSDKPVEKYLRQKAEDLRIEHKVFFHGYRKNGDALNEIYRMSDIYIIPSYFEGFPRTIWEAMANSLPVIATKVGSIPFLLEEMKNAILIDSKSVSQIKNAIISLINNESLRKCLIYNGQKLAMEQTLEKQTKLLINQLSQAYQKHKFSTSD